MFKCNIDFISLAGTILSNTGRGPLHRGHYEECLQNPQMKYTLIQFAMGDHDLKANMGLCLPRACPDKAIEGSINSALKILGTDLNIYWMKSDTQHYQFPLFWVSYLTIFLIVTLIILAFVATVKGNKSKQNKYLNSFNIMQNMKHFSIREGEDLNAWDGVRSLAMMWVVIGHSFSFSLKVIENIASIPYFGNQAYILVLEAGILSVDVFFCLGGFFLAFIMLRTKITPKICGLAILQRALRVWPAFIISMLLFYSLYMRFGSGPNWSFLESICLRCSNMWQQILFISNFTNSDAGYMCMGWIWYLQVDFQLFVVGVFLLYLYSIKKLVMYIVTAILSLLSSIFIFVYVEINKYFVPADMNEQSSDENFSYYIYNSPYGRCVPYLMGLALGVMYMEYRKQIKDKKEENVTILGRVRNMLEERKFLRIAIEWFGIGLMVLVTFIVRPLQIGSHWPQEAHSFYLVLSKPVFIFGMILTVLPSILGIRHSFFALILNVKLFAWIARISFCSYLVHLMVIVWYYYTRTYDVYYKFQDTFATYMGLLTLSLFFGFIMTMLVELPFANLLKLLMTGFKAKGRGADIVQEKKSQSLLTNESIVKQGKQPMS